MDNGTLKKEPRALKIVSSFLEMSEKEKLTSFRELNP